MKEAFELAWIGAVSASSTLIPQEVSVFNDNDDDNQL